MKKASKKVVVPAKKAAKKSATKSATKSAVKAAQKITEAATRKAAAKKAAATSAPPVPVKAAKDTVIVANVNVGFGNSLFLRGDGPGLSWSKGVPMDCAADTKWSVTMSGVTEPFEFKVLINDTYWSSGYNMIAQPGSSIEFSPEF